MVTTTPIEAWPLAALTDGSTRCAAMWLKPGTAERGHCDAIIGEWHDIAGLRMLTEAHARADHGWLPS